MRDPKGGALLAASSRIVPGAYATLKPLCRCELHRDEERALSLRASALHTRLLHSLDAQRPWALPVARADPI